MTMVRLNEAALYALGMDRVTVNALTHFIRQIGAIEGGNTLPQVAEQVVELEIAVGSVQPTLPPIEPPGMLAPPLIPQQQQDDLTPPQAVVAAIEHLQTEVRSLAEQLAAARAEIHELKQGPML